MKEDLYTIQPFGERAILINFTPEISENILENVLIVKEKIKFHYLKSSVEVINTYHSLLINYPVAIEDFYGEFLVLKKLISAPNISKKIEKKLFHIPVCYEPEFAWDMEELAVQKNLTVKQIIELHVKPIYTVFFIGFLPGFLYLGGMEQQLNFPRKKQPRPEVPKGAVGIGENQTGIYPKSSPGGWQILGNSPVEFFNKEIDPPCPFSAGDKIKFYSVSGEEFGEVKERIASGNFQLKIENYES